jgi:3-hydroxyisobutyrate dehydrogenase-like beta-hydroxyacid dehydrogenase
MDEAAMTDAVRVGFIGAGLMGHGVAKNILRKGHGLTLLAHRNRGPIEDLLAAGAKEAGSAREIAVRSDVVLTCVPSSVEVEALVFGEAGLLAGAHAGLIHLDCTTADPNSTRRIGAEWASRDCGMVDGPLGRTPKEAEEGKLSTFLGGDAAAVARVRPLVAAYADTIIEAGALGAGHTLKLVNNFISLGTSAVIAEAVAIAARLGVDLKTLHQVVSAGGANSAMFQMMMPWALEGDTSRLRGPLRIGAKDLRTFGRLAEEAPAPAFLAQAAAQLYQLALAQGHAERFIPELPGIIGGLIGAPIRPL